MGVFALFCAPFFFSGENAFLGGSELAAGQKVDGAV